MFAWTRERRIYVVAGIAERADAAFYDSAILAGPQGYIGKFRKVRLWGDEHLYFEPGNLGSPVFTAAFGRLGIMIRHDQWFPEAYRPCALRGADIVCVPTNWVPIPGQDPNREAMENIIAMAAAHTNSILSATLVGLSAVLRPGTKRRSFWPA